MESFGFSWIVLIWLSEIFEFFAVLQEELGPTGLKTATLIFAGFFFMMSYFLKFPDSF